MHWGVIFKFRRSTLPSSASAADSKVANDSMSRAFDTVIRDVTLAASEFLELEEPKAKNDILLVEPRPKFPEPPGCKLDLRGLLGVPGVPGSKLLLRPCDGLESE